MGIWAAREPFGTPEGRQPASHPGDLFVARVAVQLLTPGSSESCATTQAADTGLLLNNLI